MDTDDLREKLARLTAGLSASFWPAEAKMIERELWETIRHPKGEGCR